MIEFNESILNYEETCEHLRELEKENKKFTVLYAHINKENKKIYIGQTNLVPPDRWGSNGISYKRSPKFYKAIKKYGWNNFDHVLIKIIYDVDEIDSIEREYIEKYNTLNEGYNLTYGGKKILKHTEEQKKKIGETCRKVLREKYNTDPQYRETIKNNLSKVKNRTHYGEKNSFYGKTHSNEMKEKFLTRRVRCIETGELFNSINDACNKYNIRRTGITACCSGKQHLCGGFHWEYVDKEMKVVKNFNKNKENQKEAVSKKVICIETGKIFNSAKEAGDSVGLYNGSAIIACCRGRFQTSKGFHWMYLDDYRSTTIENTQKRK